MIIDIHAHPSDMQSAQYLAPYFQQSATERHLLDGTPVTRVGFFLSTEQYIKEMDNAGVDKTVMLNASVIPDTHIYELYLKPYPERFIGFTGSSPLIVDGNILNNGSFDQKNWESTRYSIKELGFKGIKLLPAYGHYSPLDPRVYPFYALAAELNVPLIIHMGGTPVRHAALRFTKPIDVDQILFEFPTLRINMPHMGWPWEDELLAIMVRSPNLYTDISFIGEMGLQRVANDLITARNFGVISRVMFGTDPLCRPLKFYIDWLKNDLNKYAAKQNEKLFTEDEINGILGGNALRFLGMSPKAASA
jgi:predicted TIM-barrel fold metal-dependent hydrolase